MGQPITDHAAFFASAGQAVEELEALNTEVEQLEADEKKLESSLKGKQRSVTETISQTVKQRKEEITKSYDAELGKAQDRLKKVRAKREKAKNQGVKERIEEDTRGLVRENKELADQMKTLFKANHVPGFCRGSYYYALYFTRTFKDFLALLMTIMICFLAIPCGAYFLIPESTFSIRFNSPSSQADTSLESSFLPSTSPLGKCSLTNTVTASALFVRPSRNSRLLFALRSLYRRVPRWDS